MHNNSNKAAKKKELFLPIISSSGRFATVSVNYFEFGDGLFEFVDATKNQFSWSVEYFKTNK